MGRHVEYRRQTVDTPNPIARFAHRQRYRLSLDRVAQELRQNATVLDYGCGDGEFLQSLADLRPDLSLYGYDPESGHTANGYRAVQDMGEISAESIDLVCCFETLEHLYEDEIAEFLGDSTRVMKDDARMTVSVPVIGGPPLLLKELNRMVLFRKATDYSLGELAAASLRGRPAPRPVDIRHSHKGFDFRALGERLAERFAITEVAYSPFGRLPWWLNSQVFYFLR
jgi:hypothetical protein